MQTAHALSPSPVDWWPPRDLITIERLDITVKARFFQHLDVGGDPAAERVYREHIAQRTGGVEHRSWKRTVDHYVDACRNLLASMDAHGFDARHPVVVGSNGRLMDGAHRIACARVLGLPLVAVHRRPDKPGKAAPWGRDWFLRHGFGAADIARIEADFAALAAR